jgi:acetyltransferase-like isoleucine patch superfamily enzyme
MRALISRVMQVVFRPMIWFVAWAQAQRNQLENTGLLKRLDCEDASTIKLYDAVHIVAPDRCHLGKHVSIHDAEWNATGHIHIGNYVHFGPRVTILTLSHNHNGEEIPYDSTHVYKPVVIEDCVWVGCDVVIAPGTHIEEGCIIAMGATVSGRIAKGSIVGAAKPRTLSMRDMEKYERLKVEGKFH